MIGELGPKTFFELKEICNVVNSIMMDLLVCQVDFNVKSPESTAFYPIGIELIAFKHFSKIEDPKRYIEVFKERLLNEAFKDFSIKENFGDSVYLNFKMGLYNDECEPVDEISINYTGIESAFYIARNVPLNNAMIITEGELRE